MTRYDLDAGVTYIGVLRPFVITDEDIFRARTKLCPMIAALT